MKIFMLLLCATIAHAAETKVKLADVPAAVQKTIKEKSQGAKLKHIVKDTSKDATTYEAEMIVNGKEKTVTIDATGNVSEIEETVALSSLPPRAQGAIMKAAEGGKVLKVESVSHGGPVETYEALIKKAGKKKEFAVDPDGKPVAD